MALLASGVNLANPLKDPLSKIGQKSQMTLQDILGRVRSANAEGQAVSGRPIGQYTGMELDRAGMMGGRNIEDSLYGVLGGASYQDARNAKRHQLNLDLARRIGGLNKPSTLQEVLGGIGQAGQLYTAGKSIAGSFKSPKSGRNPMAPAEDYYFSDDFTGGF